MPLAILNSDFAKFADAPLDLMLGDEPQIVDFLQRWPSKFECRRDGSKWLVSLTRHAEMRPISSKARIARSRSPHREVQGGA